MANPINPHNPNDLKSAQNIPGGLEQRKAAEAKAGSPGKVGEAKKAELKDSPAAIQSAMATPGSVMQQRLSALKASFAAFFMWLDALKRQHFFEEQRKILVAHMHEISKHSSKLSEMHGPFCDEDQIRLDEMRDKSAHLMRDAHKLLGAYNEKSLEVDALHHELNSLHTAHGQVQAATADFGKELNLSLSDSLNKALSLNGIDSQNISLMDLQRDIYDGVINRFNSQPQPGTETHVENDITNILQKHSLSEDQSRRCAKHFCESGGVNEMYNKHAGKLQQDLNMTIPKYSQQSHLNPLNYIQMRMTSCHNKKAEAESTLTHMSAKLRSLRQELVGLGAHTAALDNKIPGGRGQMQPQNAPKFVPPNK